MYLLTNKRWSRISHGLTKTVIDFSLYSLEMSDAMTLGQWKRESELEDARE